MIWWISRRGWIWWTCVNSLKEICKASPFGNFGGWEFWWLETLVAGNHLVGFQISQIWCFPTTGIFQFRVGPNGPYGAFR